MDLSQLGLDNVYFECYGSYKNGLGTQTSDVDITIRTNSYFDERKLLQYVKCTLDKSVDPTKYKIEALIKEDVKVPLIQYETIPQNGEQKVQLDISVNNLLGIVNSKMIEVYTSIDDKVKQLGVLIKLWAKQQGVQAKHMMTSYSLILLMINFLQQENLVPQLQSIGVPENKIKNFDIDIKRDRQQGTNEVFTTNIYFLQDKEKLKHYMLNNQFKKFKDYTIEQLLSKFFKFYADYIDKNYKQPIEQQYRISISGKDENSKKRDDSDTEYLFSIIDPFDIKHNPGDRPKPSQEDNIERIKQKFEYASNKPEHKLHELFEDRRDRSRRR